MNWKRILYIAITVVVLIIFFTVPQRSEGQDQNLGLLTLFPPLLVIILSFTTHNVILSLAIGVFVGASIINGGNIFYGFLRSFDQYVIGEVTDSWNASLLLFILGIGGLLTLMIRMGGSQAIADILSRKAKTAKSTLITTWLLCLAIFFEDIASTLIVGPAMRPSSDKMRISREKLSYVLDSTAAPVSDIAIISTWIAYEISMVKIAFDAAGVEVNAYNLFLRSVPFRYYNVLAIIMVLIIVLSNRDYGPMYRAEYRARTTGKIYADGSNPMIEGSDTDYKVSDNIKPKAFNAYVPIILLVACVFSGLWYNGGGLNEPFNFSGIQTAFGNADASIVILWSVMFTSVVTILMAVGQKMFTLAESIEIWVNGCKTMLLTCLILLLAWSIGSVMSDLGTANYLIGFIGGAIPPFALPLLLFVIACFVAFSTGTSFGTTGIMLPMAIPLALSYTNMEITTMVVACIGAVTAGAVFGDHCSPISDTSILASMGAGSDHVDHVKTQIPYAITVAIVSGLAGYLLAGFGMTPLLSYPLALGALILIVYSFGKKLPDVDGVEK